MPIRSRVAIVSSIQPIGTAMAPKSKGIVERVEEMLGIVTAAVAEPAKKKKSPRKKSAKKTVRKAAKKSMAKRPTKKAKRTKKSKR